MRCLQPFLRDFDIDVNARVPMVRMGADPAGAPRMSALSVFVNGGIRGINGTPSSDDKASVRMLLEAGADIHQKDRDGLHSALDRAIHGKHTDIIEWMLAQGGSMAPAPNMLLTVLKHSGFRDHDSAFAQAVLQSCASHAPQLITARRAADGMTPLLLAALRAKVAPVAFKPTLLALLRHEGLNPTRPNTNGETALYFAVSANIDSARAMKRAKRNKEEAEAKLAASSAIALGMLQYAFNSGLVTTATELQNALGSSKVSFDNMVTRSNTLKLPLATCMNWFSRRPLALIRAQRVAARDAELAEKLRQEQAQRPQVIDLRLATAS